MPEAMTLQKRIRVTEWPAGARERTDQGPQGEQSHPDQTKRALVPAPQLHYENCRGQKSLAGVGNGRGKGEQARHRECAR